MKRCPHCGSTYTDDSLNYCLQDGTQLIRPHFDAQADTLKVPASENQKSIEADTIYDELVGILKGIEIKVSIKKITDTEDEAERIKLHLKTLENITDDEELTVDLFSILKTYGDVLIIGIYNSRNMRSMERLLFFDICPKLQIYDLAFNEGVPNVAYRRFALTTKGIGLLKYINRNNL